MWHNALPIAYWGVEMDQAKIDAKLQELSQRLGEIQWREDQKRPDGTLFSGIAPGFIVTAAEFDISDQGFPASSYGYEGVVSFPAENTIIRLPRDLAHQIVQEAMAKLDVDAQNPSD